MPIPTSLCSGFRLFGLVTFLRTFLSLVHVEAESRDERQDSESEQKCRQWRVDAYRFEREESSPASNHPQDSESDQTRLSALTHDLLDLLPQFQVLAGRFSLLSRLDCLGRCYDYCSAFRTERSSMLKLSAACRAELH